MKKFFKFLFRIITLGAALGAAFAYLKSKGYITVSTNNEDEDYDDFSSVDTEGTERTYINVDTNAMKAKAKEMAMDMKVKATEFAEDVYDEAKEKVKDASQNIAHALEKAWYEAEDTVEDTVEKVEEFFNDED